MSRLLASLNNFSDKESLTPKVIAFQVTQISLATLNKWTSETINLRIS